MIIDIAGSTTRPRPALRAVLRVGVRVGRGTARPAGWRSGPTDVGWIVLFGGGGLLAAGVAFGYPALTGLGVAAAAALGSAALVHLVRPRVAVGRELSANRVTVGDPALARLTVTNLGRFPAAGFDAVELVDGEPLRIRMRPLEGGGRRSMDVAIATPRRGLIRLGPVVVERRDPLGLIRHVLPLSNRTWLWVWPRVHPVRPLPLGLVPDFEGRLADEAPRGGTAFASLREYEAGDDPRLIHWRSTARLGSLVVREHADTTDPTTAIVVDTRTDALDADTFEAAVEMAASVAVASLRVGHEVTLHAPGEDRRAVATAGGHEILDRLAALGQIDDAEPSTLVRVAEQAKEGGSLVVVTGAETGLVGRLAAVRRRFARIVVIALGPESAVIRRPGLVVIHAPSAAEAAQAWTRLIA
ncbi:MAG TPA: DUF58 domain-containing protein [Streptosporangiaceae bacterium]|nr:DUF58 domain-containing protein [Streptosporangiaceae bacterium]